MALYLFILLSLFSLPLQALTLEEKVGQILMVHFQGEEANEEAKTLIQDLHIGGFIYYNWSNNLSSPQQVKNLSQHLQELSKTPLLLATDQEGGIVARLQNGFTLFPGNAALGRTNQPRLAKESAFIMGKEMQSVGINMNLAPVVDINSNPLNPVIGIRSFGKDPLQVIAFAEKTLEGYEKACLVTCLKHFPGHGDVLADPHYALPILNKSKEALKNRELIPFQHLHMKADTIMTAHLLVPEIDPLNCATLSKPVLDILRQEIGFEGVIISDSLVMEGVLKSRSSIDEVAIDALNAGCDILLLGGRQLSKESRIELTLKDIQRVHSSLVQAVKTGRIPEKRLDEAVAKIAALKEKNLKNPPNPYPLNTEEGNNLARAIALDALEFIGKKSTLLSKSNSVIVAPLTIKENLEKSPFANRPTVFFNPIYPEKEEAEKILELEEQGKQLLFFSYNAKTNPEQLKLIQSLNAPFTLIALRNPEEISLFPKASLLINTFSPSVPSLEALSSKIPSISLDEAEEIGNKIFQNECGGKVENLTFWSPKEDFPSLGIGHFIWYPEHKDSRFEETFPLLLNFLICNGATLPAWLHVNSDCPWESRALFYTAIQTPEMKQLRYFLVQTKNLQALFMAERLEKSLPQILEELPAKKRSSAEAHFASLMKTPQGTYALVDYLNFKGPGTAKSERYEGQGWGLAQVLEAMPENSPDPLKAFALAAKKILLQRVKNAPPDRHEEQWLKGWLKRVETYEG